MKSINRRPYLKLASVIKPNKCSLKRISITKLILITILFVIVIESFNNMSLVAIKTINVDLRAIVSNERDSTPKDDEREDGNTKQDDESSRSSILDILSELSSTSQTSTISAEIAIDLDLDRKTIDKNPDEKYNSEGQVINNKNADVNFDTAIDTHPLENLCKYGILHPWEESIMDYLRDVSNLTCDKILPDIIKFQDGKISVDRDKVGNELNMSIACKYRPIGGALWPKKNVPIPIGEWVTITEEASSVLYDQIEVECYGSNGNNTQLVYKFALAHVIPKDDKTFEKSTEDMLSLNIIEMDSVSRNAFQRHMPISFEYLTKNMKAFDMKGFMKVGDNTLPNLLPILTGLRYLNLSDDMPSDFALDKPNDVDSMSSLWKEYKG